MRQVSKKEFEILKKFHPAEIRYYVDIRKAKYEKETYRGKAVKKSKARKSLNGTGKGHNRPVMMIRPSHKWSEFSRASKMQVLLNHQYEGRPLAPIGRTDLLNAMTEGGEFGKNQAGPFISDCLKHGILQYK